MNVCLTVSLRQAVMAKDIAAARSAILTELRDDRMRDQPIALGLADLVSKELPGFYEPDNGLYSSPGDSPMTEDLWMKARSAMMLNFSRERLCFIETIVRSFEPSRPMKSSYPKKTVTVHGRCKSIGRIVWMLLIVVGAAATASIVSASKKRQAPSDTADSINVQHQIDSTRYSNEHSCMTNSRATASTNDIRLTSSAKDDK